MEDRSIVVEVYGAEEICASCVHLPSSQETASWLEAALNRKYGKQVKVAYVDIYQPKTDRERRFANKVLEEDLWYPVVVIQDEIVGEGNPKLKKIYEHLEKLGLQPLFS